MAVAIALREPIAEWLLGESATTPTWSSGRRCWAATTLIFRLASIVIWFERRPGAFLACELSPARCSRSRS